jgi:hypothetical protein
LRLTSDQNDGGSGDYTGATFDLFWNLGGDKSGYNVGPYDVAGGGVPYNNYVADSLLQAVVLKFETEPLVAHYRLNDNMQNVRVIDSQHTSDGTLTGGDNTADVSIAGLIARAFGFDGAHYVNCNATFKAIFQGSFAISFWMKPNDGQPGVTNFMFGVNKGSADYVQGILGSSGNLTFQYGVDGNNSNFKTSVASPIFADGPAANWYHIVYVADATIAGDYGIRIYGNGAALTPHPSYLGNTSAVTFANFDADPYLPFIGCRNVNGSPSGYFTGGIDDVRIYRGALTLAQVEALYNAGKGTEQTRPSELFAGSAIGQREVAIGETATITKATDLGGNSPAVIRVVPRRVLESKLQNKITVAQV